MMLWLALLFSIITGHVAAYTGHARIHNNCRFPVYMWIVDSDRNPMSPSVIHAQETYSEEYHIPSRGGTSLKLSLQSSLQSPITQLEYTRRNGPGDLVWYDVSNVDCEGSNCPFVKYGLSLTTTSDCPTVVCPPATPLCNEVYNEPFDDFATHACPKKADINLHLCNSDLTSAFAAQERFKKSRPIARSVDNLTDSHSDSEPAQLSASSSYYSQKYNLHRRYPLSPSSALTKPMDAATTTTSSNSLLNSKDLIPSPHQRQSSLTETSESGLTPTADQSSLDNRLRRRNLII